MTAPVTRAPDADANHVATGKHMQSFSAKLTRGSKVKAAIKLQLTLMVLSVTS
jgi:hypothetical protein